MSAFAVINLFCAAAFLVYGATCLFSSHMRREFERYRLARFRVLTGILQLLAAAGLLLGMQIPLIGAAAAAGLAVQMLLGLWVRRRIHDSLRQSLPALFFCLLSTWLFSQFLQL